MCRGTVFQVYMLNLVMSNSACMAGLWYRYKTVTARIPWVWPIGQDDAAQSYKVPCSLLAFRAAEDAEIYFAISLEFAQFLCTSSHF
jgi:hypothetical protein